MQEMQGRKPVGFAASIPFAFHGSAGSGEEIGTIVLGAGSFRVITALKFFC
jgi:hypothetical protein